MEPQPVVVTGVSGEALDWIRLVFVMQLALGLVIVVALVALTVVVFWRGA